MRNSNSYSKSEFILRKLNRLEVEAASLKQEMACYARTKDVEKNESRLIDGLRSITTLTSPNGYILRHLSEADGQAYSMAITMAIKMVVRLKDKPQDMLDADYGIELEKANSKVDSLFAHAAACRSKAMIREFATM